MAIIEGQFLSRVYSNCAKSYHVFYFKPTGKQPVKAILRGSDGFPELRGETYTLQGKWSKSERYGWQFTARKVEKREEYAERRQMNISYLEMMLC